MSLFPCLKESLLLKVDDYFCCSVMNVLVCAENPLPFGTNDIVLSVKERCSRVCLYTNLRMVN